MKSPTLTRIRPGRGGEVDLDFSLEPRFKPGELIAVRYEVEGFIARGGMGEVYRVFDRELGERIALKTIRPRAVDDPQALDRFRREIQLARKISHLNVCRIFDLGRHAVEGSEDVVFLTMELLSGISLRARLKEGPMTPAEALSVVRQLCAGLGAAHRKGIIHRDLKPSNVFLVPEGEGTRVVIADFGLARTEVKDDGEQTVTRTGELLGTPAYMAPEQLEGEEATAASDIYAVGLVIYELLTGARPFEGSSAFQTALNKLRETPSTPSSRVRGLHPRWDHTILRCLETEPAERFEHVEDIPAALAGQRSGGRSHDAVPWRRIGFLAAAVMLLVAIWLVGAKLANRMQQREELVPLPVAEPMVAAASDLRDSMAILGFENITGNPAASGVCDELRKLLTERFEAGAQLLVVPAEKARSTRTELAIGRLSTLGPESLAGLQESLGVDLVVLGSCAVFSDEGTIRLDARVQNIKAGEIIIVPSVHGPVNDLETVADDAAAAIRLKLGFAASGAADGD